MNYEENLIKEIINILDNVYYWESCPQEYNDRIDAIKKHLENASLKSAEKKPAKQFLEEYDPQLKE